MKRIVCVMMAVIMISMLVSASAVVNKEKAVLLGSLKNNGEYQVECNLPEGYKVKEAKTDSNESALTAIVEKEGETGPIICLSIKYDDYFDYPSINEMPYGKYTEFRYGEYDYQGAYVSETTTDEGNIYLRAYDDEYVASVRLGSIINGFIVDIETDIRNEEDPELTMDDSIPAEELLNSIRIRKNI